MSCKHCEMRDIKRGSVTYTEGEKYEDPPYHSAYIEEDYDCFWLWVERLDWCRDYSETACIPIRCCPWCGDELTKEVRDD